MRKSLVPSLSVLLHLCEPNLEVNPEDDQSFLQLATAIARTLCLFDEFSFTSL